jgi:hypothetical protein
MLINALQALALCWPPILLRLKVRGLGADALHLPGFQLWTSGQLVHLFVSQFSHL